MFTCPVGHNKSQLIRRSAGCVLVVLILGFLLCRHLVTGGRVLRRAQPPATAGLVSPRVPSLHVDLVVQHGDIVEIEGATEADATVMINGEPAATLFEGTAFRHFVGPLRPGVTVLTITAQSFGGGVNTQQIAVEVIDTR